MLYDEVAHKVENNITDTAFEAGVKKLVTYFPSAHIFPNSAYLVRGTVGARTWEEFQVHVCADPNCVGYVYPYLDPVEWAAHKDQVCPVQGCNQRRFQVVKQGNTEVVVPRWWYIDFGLEEVGVRCSPLLQLSCQCCGC
jgi:hypothetical protein